MCTVGVEKISFSIPVPKLANLFESNFKFTLIDQIVKSAKILVRLRQRFGEDTLGRTQMFY